MINSHDSDKSDVCIISHSSGFLHPASDQPKVSSTILRKRRRSMMSSSSSATPNVLQVESRKSLSSCEYDSAPTTAYGQYLKTGAYYLPDSYEEVPVEPSNISSEAKIKQNKPGPVKSKMLMGKSGHAWAKVTYSIF